VKRVYARQSSRARTTPNSGTILTSSSVNIFKNTNYPEKDMVCSQREGRIAPWEEVAIDLIVPWTVKVNNRKVKFNSLVCINIASNLVELTRIKNKTL
jgi:hypothetical protein